MHGVARLVDRQPTVSPERLVALTDRLYDAGIPVLASGGFRKKYLRATSRLLALSAAVDA